MTIFHAAQATSPGAELAIVDRTLADPGPGTGRVAVEARGICHSDSVFVDDQWPGLQFPVTPGHEIAGRIDAVGEGLSGAAIITGMLPPLPPLYLNDLPHGSVAGGPGSCQVTTRERDAPQSSATVSLRCAVMLSPGVFARRPVIAGSTPTAVAVRTG